MNDNAKLWVEALRSGKHTQGTGMLENYDGSLCCLGVVCLVAEETGIKLVRSDSDNRIAGGNLSNQPEVQKWLNLNSPLGHFLGEKSLTVLNDNGKTFEELADVIEQNFETLFNTSDKEIA
jgi:hypothetical protein